MIDWQALEKKLSLWLNFGAEVRIEFYLKLASFIEDGMAPTDGIQRMLEVAERRRSSRALVPIYRDMLSHISGGARDRVVKTKIASAVGEHIPAVEAGMLLAGEEGGDLHAALLELISLLETQTRLRSLLRSSLASSAALTVGTALLAWFILGTVVPQAQNMITPELAKTMMLAPVYFALGNALLSWGPWLAALLILGVMAALLSLPRWSAPAREWVDRHWLPWTLYRDVQSAYVLIAVASMLNAGIQLRIAVENLARHADRWQADHLARMADGLAMAKDPASAMDTGLLTDRILDELYVYSLLPQFGKVMSRMAKISLRIYEQRLKRISAMIKYAVMAFATLFILATIFSLGEVALTVMDAVSTQTNRIAP